MPEGRFTVEARSQERQYVLLDLKPEEEAGVGAAGPKVIGEEVFVDVSQGDAVADRVLYHTYVSEDYGGQGLASVLVRAVVEDAIASGYKVVPVCPYVSTWLVKHPEYSNHVVKPNSDHLRAIPQK